MNDDIMLVIIMTLKDKTREKDIDMKMTIEEYLDWIRYSEHRYKKDYINYKMMLETIQAYYVLKDEDEALKTINLFINNLMQ
ncbi:MAG: hypothetical protein IJF92_00755 [Bacilli bacterium]|nr:hypothetical protein [Bacilli bacterium]MBQ3307656.1 hypothetical protein [Bacilli bacterium]